MRPTALGLALVAAGVLAGQVLPDVGGPAPSSPTSTAVGLVGTWDVVVRDADGAAVDHVSFRNAIEEPGLFFGATMAAFLDPDPSALDDLAFPGVRTDPDRFEFVQWSAGDNRLHVEASEVSAGPSFPTSFELDVVGIESAFPDHDDLVVVASGSNTSGESVLVESLSLDLSARSYLLDDEGRLVLTNVSPRLSGHRLVGDEAFVVEPGQIVEVTITYTFSEVVS